MKMLIKLSVILTVLHVTNSQDKKLNWDLAVVFENQIQLLHSNGTVIDSKEHPFSSLKALAYDNVRDQFIVSDMHNNNDTVYTVQIAKDITIPIIKGLPGDVQGLAVDPIDDVLYWTDGMSSAIFYVPLNESFVESKKIILNNDTIPHTLAIDVCKRYIYWTNPRGDPSIERIKLDGSNQEVFISHLLMTPEGLAIDYKAQKLYWADSRVGTVGGRIESINLDNTDRKIVVEKNTMQPYGLAVSEDAIYFTDTNNHGLYRFPKGKPSNFPPEAIEQFGSMPMGLVANNNIVKEEPDCKVLEEAIQNFKEIETEDMFYPKLGYSTIECQNGGKHVFGDSCDCPYGYFGKQCEFSSCTNFCFHGKCLLSSSGLPSCHCSLGFVGERCQRDRCDGYCLNGGDCKIYSMRDRPKCRCQQGYFGDRCELSVEFCEIYCSGRNYDFYSNKFDTSCNCASVMIQSRMNHTAAALSSSSDPNNFLNKLNDPVIYLSALLFFCLLIIVALTIYIRTVQKRRPRIKKRIIVNKNITPLTYRPQPTTEQQCEITIENCCNMNVCETPCFEPRGEDKKKLLTNMEGEDLY